MNLEYKKLSTDQLYTELLSAEAASQELVYNHSIAPLQNPQEIKSAKKYVARLKTELRSRELSESNGLNRDRIVSRRKKQKNN